MNPLLTPEQVATLLGVPLEIVKQLVSDGEMSFYAVGPEETVRFSEAQVQAYLAGCERTLMKENVEESAPEQPPQKPLKHLELEEQT